MTLAGALAAVAGERRQTGQQSCGQVRAGAEFGHTDDEHRRRDRADAGDRADDGKAVRQVWLAGEAALDLGLEPGNVALDAG